MKFILRNCNASAVREISSAALMYDDYSYRDVVELIKANLRGSNPNPNRKGTRTRREPDMHI